jgi:hypothetical protein
MEKKLRKFIARNNLEYQVIVVAAIAYLFYLHFSKCV